MNKEWIKFSEREPQCGAVIWAASIIDQPIVCIFQAGCMNRLLTHWMPCDRPERPLPAPEELALEEYVITNPQTTIEKVWSAAIKWERERKK